MGKWTAHAVERVPTLGVCCDEQEVGLFDHVCPFYVGAGLKPARTKIYIVSYCHKINFSVPVRQIWNGKFIAFLGV